MNHSLQKRLSWALGITIFLSAIIVAAISFELAYAEAQEFQDKNLKQMAALCVDLARQSENPQHALERIRKVIHDQDPRMMLLLLNKGESSSWIPTDLSPGFHTVRHGNSRLRLFVQGMPNIDDSSIEVRIAIGQYKGLIDEIAMRNALRSLLYLLLLLPLLLIIIIAIVRREMSSVKRMAQYFDEQSGQHPQPLTAIDTPVEIAPFIDALNRFLTRINRLMGEQQRFIADAAHELRTPLAALSIQAQNLDRTQSMESLKTRLIPLRKGIERARHLTEQLLNFARTHADDSDAVVVEVSILLRELIADALPFAETRDIDLGLDETTFLKVFANPQTLRLIIKNAINNALRYSPPNSVVTVRLACEDEQALIEVIDAGPGIPRGERERVFQAFYRIAGAAGEGSGLGLAIAKDAALRIGAQLSLHEPASRTGLVFRIKMKKLSDA